MINIGNFFFRYRNILLPISFLLILVPSPEIFKNPTIALVLGLGLSIAGQLIRFTTIGLVYIIRGGANRRIHAEGLVTAGIFSHCRNPLYVGNITVSIGMAIASNSVLFFSVITPFIIFVYMAIVMAEEDFLWNKFGAAFDDYTKEVNRWIPSLKDITRTFKSHNFSWKRVLLKEYNSTFSGTLLGILMIMKAYYVHPEFYGAFRENLFAFLYAIAAVTIVYLFIKFLKKTHRLVAN